MGKLSKYIDPDVLAGISRLDIRARVVVEGFISGLHRSPFHGYSVEFAQHRAYVPGDDLKHVDWKLFARADRFYVKLYEEETNLKAYILVDCSRSMHYRAASSVMSKYDYACTVAASMAYLLLLQQDAVGLSLFDDTVRDSLPPSSSPAHLTSICRVMEAARPERRTDLSRLFHQLAEQYNRKGIVLIMSDFFAPVEDVIRGLLHFQHNKHEVLVFHVLDRQELEFNLTGNIRFVGLEGEEPITTDAKRIRGAYRSAVKEFCRSIEAACNREQMEYVLMDTSKPIEMALSRFLHRRGG